MEPALEVGLLWIVFAGTHVGLATRRPRAALVARLGESGFVGLFSVIASLAFTALAHVYATQRFAGAAGPALGASWPWRVVLIAAIVGGVGLTVASLGAYPGSAYAIGTTNPPGPRGLERITRHPFFVGFALAAGAHALLASHLVGTVFFGGLATLALGGAWHQDRKLAAQRGPSFASFLAVTSMMPFAAIVSGRQRLVPRELPWPALAAAVPVVLFLNWAHDSIFDRGGLWVILAVVGGPLLLLLQDWRVARRRVRRGLTDPGRVRHEAGAPARQPETVGRTS